MASLVRRGGAGIGLRISTCAGRFRENLLEKMEKNMSLFFKEILAIKLKLEEITHTIRVEQGLKPWLKIGISRSFKKYRVLAWESPG